MLDIDAFANAIAPYVGAAVAARGPGVRARLGEDSPDPVVRFGQQLLSVMLSAPDGRPGVARAVDELAVQPAEPDFQAALRGQIRLALHQDPALAAALFALTPPAVPQQPDGPAGSVIAATGTRSAAMTGNSGIVSTGDGSVSVQNSVISASGRKSRVIVGGKINKRKILLFPFVFFWHSAKTVAAVSRAHPVVAAAASTFTAGAVVAAVVLTSPAPAPAPDLLAGYWKDTSGNYIQFVPDGPHAWTGQVVYAAGNVCLPVNIKVTETNGTYKGTESYYQEPDSLGASSGCGSSVGLGTVTFTLNAMDTAAQVAFAPPTTVSCGACAPATWTKVAFAPKPTDACPPTEPAARPFAGWSAVGEVTLTKGSDPGGLCLSSSMQFWAGILLPTVPETDYTVTVRGRLESASQAWGVAARVSVSGGTVTGHALQYEPAGPRLRDNDYPGDGGPEYYQPPDNPTYQIPADTKWHTLTVAVQGTSYLLSFDGVQIASGTLSQQAEAAGGVFIRIWGGATVEITEPVITPLTTPLPLPSPSGSASPSPGAATSSASPSDAPS